MKILLKRPRQRETAAALLLTGGGTDDLEVIELLAEQAPSDTIFERETKTPLTLELLQGILRAGMDPR